MPNAFPPDLQKSEQAHALLEAAKDGDADAVASLLDAGADPCARRADGFTPLILAVFFGHEHVARLLLERGADASARTNLGTTAGRWASARGFSVMAELLREAEATRPPADAAVARPEMLAASPDDGAARRSLLNLDRPDASAAPAVSVRTDGRVPVHPSASAFRLGHFLRSWQGSVGVALLLLALAVSVFALMRGGKLPRGGAQPSPAPTVSAPQPAAQTPAQTLPAPQPSPAFATPDPQAVLPVTDPAFVAPNAGAQPFYAPPAAAVPLQPNAPRDLMVVSESGSPSPEGTPRTKRKAGPAPDDSAPASAQGQGRVEQGAAPDARPVPATHTADAEQRPAQSPAPPAPVPSAQPTPGRAKVIQWPPQ